MHGSDAPAGRETQARPSSRRSAAGDLLAVDVPATATGGAKLPKLAIEGLPGGRDAGIADKPFFEVSFDYNLCKP